MHVISLLVLVLVNLHFTWEQWRQGYCGSLSDPGSIQFSREMQIYSVTRTCRAYYNFFFFFCILISVQTILNTVFRVGNLSRVWNARWRSFTVGIFQVPYFDTRFMIYFAHLHLVRMWAVSKKLVMVDFLLVTIVLKHLCLRNMTVCVLWTRCTKRTTHIGRSCSSVRIFNFRSCYGLDDRGSRVRFPAGAVNFSHHRVQNGSGAHPASYPMGTRGSFPGGKAAEREANHTSPSSAEVKEWVELYLHSPNTPLWCGA
jgi:hypothetical protein